MNKYNVISGKGTLIPDWIVEKMLDEQVKQGNPRDVKVFENDVFTNKMFGGFTWIYTENYKQNNNYWLDIIQYGIYPPKPSTDVDELVEKVSNVIRDTLTNSFVLPERWCIKGTTHDECMAINAYARSLQGGDHWVDKHNNAKYYYLCIKDGKYLKGDYNINGTLITFEQFQKYVLGVEFILPKLWGVKLTEQSIDTVTGWRRTTTKPAGFEIRDSKFYGSYILNKEPNSKFTAFWVNSLPKGYTEITYEQFLKYVLKSSFILPERWCVKVGDPSKYNVFNTWRKTSGAKLNYHGSDGYLAYAGIFYSGLPKNHTLITYEQFLQYVVKGTAVVEKSPKYKVGDWVSFTSEVDKCIYTSKIKDWTSHSYCVLENKQEPFKHLLRKATSEEIKDAEKDALLAEAKSKYPIGTMFKSPYSGCIREVTGKIRTTIDNYGLVDDEGYILFKGKWAEIIKTPYITINGYKVEFFRNYVKFGYAEINKEVFIDLATINEYANTNRDVESVTIGRGVFTKAQIKEIADYYNDL